jgi:hypothetical protein
MKQLLMIGGIFTSFLFIALIVLVGCTSNLAGGDQFKKMDKHPSHLSKENFVALGVNSTIQSGQSISGYLDDRGIDSYGDKDWYLLEGVTTGSKITVELVGSDSGDFDLAIWRDGNWVAYDDSPSSNARLSDTAGTTTWIWVGIWSGKGSYTLKVNTATSGACSEGRLEEPVTAYLAPYIKKACYDNGVWRGAGMQLTLTDEGRRGCQQTVSWCATFANFVLSRKSWKGNRLLKYVTMEIYLHSVAGRVNPTHIEYMCEDVDWRQRLFYGENC